MISGLNHLTFAVRDLDRALSFYVDLLGCVPQVRWNGGAYLSAGNTWICLSLDAQAAQTPPPHYTHIAFSVAAAQFDALAARLRAADVPEWKSNRSEGASIYILDPDQHKLEIHVGNLQSRLQSLREKPYAGLQWLNGNPDGSSDTDKKANQE